MSALDSRASLGERLELFLRICDAVSFAHAQGIVHRDLKPDNVMLRQLWRSARDGLGRRQGAWQQPARDDVIVGTPGFMAPEQAVGDGVSVDARADVYALGVILDWDARPAPAASRSPPSRPSCTGERRSTSDTRALPRSPPTSSRFRDGRPGGCLSRIASSSGSDASIGRIALPILLVVAYMVMRVILLLLWQQAADHGCRDWYRVARRG